MDLYHYTESGLQNVFLSGIKIAACGKCGERYPVVPSILDLHEKIAEAVALKPVPLTAEEAKFLRKQLGIGAGEWAMYLRLDKATVSRYENGHNPIGKQLDAFMRFLYFRLLEERNRRHVVENIASRIASVSVKSTENIGFSLPADNPSAYSFGNTKTLAKAAAA